MNKAQDLLPSIPIHPGEMIKDELAYREITQREFAQNIGLSPSVLNEILNGKRSVTTEYALLFEASLGIEADLWLRVQSDYNKQIAMSDKSFLKKLKAVKRYAAAL